MTLMAERQQIDTDSMSGFAETIYKNKYEQDGEGWHGTAARVVDNVLRPIFPEIADEMTEAITSRKFMPGGRYLYASGKQFHQTQNCLLLKVEDSRESIADLMNRVTSGLMTGAGIGIVWSDLREDGAFVRGMGGTSTGPIAFMQMVNEIGRHIMQGGSRRSAIWAGLHWNHPDVFKFISIKDWSDDIKAMKEKDFNAAAPLDGTNISVILDDDFFEAMENENYSKTFSFGGGQPITITHDWAQKVYWLVVEKMLTTAEPGFSIDTGENAGEHLRNAPVAGHTRVLTDNGYVPVSEIVGTPSSIWTGQQFAKDVVFKETDDNAQIVRVSMTGGRYIDCDPTHPFMINGARIAASELKVGQSIDVSLPLPNFGDFSSSEYTLGWLYGDGSFSGRRAELTLCSDESKNCLPWISGYSSINEVDGRGYTRIYFASDYKWEGRSKESVSQSDITPSFIAGLFDADGNWNQTQKRIRLSSVKEGFLHDVRLGLESMGIMAHVSKAGRSTYGQSQTYQLVVASESMQRFASIIPCKRLLFDLEGYKSYRQSKIKVLSIESLGFGPVYCADVQVPEHSFVAEGVVISNCTEITSRDDNDICNLGSINMARVESKEEFARLVEIGTAFLLAGTEYSLVPFQQVADTRTKNRRLGLGLMGIYEWLVKRGYTYDPNDELADWLDEYAKSTEIAAAYADRLGISRPIKTRAIAPTGTIGILAETTTGLEPLFAAAMKRRYLRGTKWHFQYIVDQTAKRIIERTGADGDALETAYDLAKTPERRIKFQAWLQKWVDHGISSTLNLPAVDQQNFTHEEFGTMLYKYLPNLRGVTCYPDGARGGQPLTVVPYSEAIDWEGFEYEEVGNGMACVSGACGV